MTRPFAAPAALVAALLPAAACRDIPVAETIEEAPRLASSVRMGDAAASGQLAGGFYEIESDAWRWTMQKFAVNLRPPAGSARQGAMLELSLSVPRSNLDQLGKITLAASVGSTQLAPETYTQAGDYSYRREVPASVLGGDAVRIDFQLDKALPPGDMDQRELGLIVSSVGLLSK